MCDCRHNGNGARNCKFLNLKSWRRFLIPLLVGLGSCLVLMCFYLRDIQCAGPPPGKAKGSDLTTRALLFAADLCSFFGRNGFEKVKTADLCRLVCSRSLDVLVGTYHAPAPPKKAKRLNQSPQFRARFHERSSSGPLNYWYPWAWLVLPGAPLYHHPSSHVAGGFKLACF
jgi:hypothetical protein